MADCHIDKTWLLSWETPLDEVDPQYNFVYLNQRALPNSIRALPGIFPAGARINLCWVMPLTRAVLDSIDRLQAAIEIHGVRVCGEAQTAHDV